MPTVTQINSSASITIAGQQYNCQFSTFTFNTGGYGAPEVMRTACPDGGIANPGSWEPPVLTGTLAGDTTAAGITTALLDALEANETVALVVTMWDDQGATVAYQYEVDCYVSPFGQTFEPGKVFMHDLTLTGTGPATKTRPA